MHAKAHLDLRRLEQVIMRAWQIQNRAPTSTASPSIGPMGNKRC